MCLIPLRIEDTPEYQYKPDYEAAFKRMRRKHWFTLGIFNSIFKMHPEFYSATYDMIQHAKAPLVARAAQHNVFGSKAFAWLDGGLHTPMDKWIPPQNLLNIKTCTDGKVCYGFNKDLKKQKPHQLQKFGANKDACAFTGNNYGAGAVITGNAKAWKKFQRDYSDMVRDYLEEKIMDDDQGIMLHMYTKNCLDPNSGAECVIEDVRCKGYERCPGWALGKWNYTSTQNRSQYLYEPE